MRSLPMFEGRWNDYLERYFRYDVEDLPSGTVRSKAARAPSRKRSANLERERLWVYHHQVKAPTLIFRAPDGLLTPTDCLMTQDEAEAMARAIPSAKLVVVPRPTTTPCCSGRTRSVKIRAPGFPQGDIATADAPVSHTRDLTIRFGGHVAVDHVSLDVPAARAQVASSGPTAPGKTTLFNLLCGQYRPPRAGSPSRARTSRAGRGAPHAARGSGAPSS